VMLIRRNRCAPAQALSSLDVTRPNATPQMRNRHEH
jgi:hypothetical protein